MKKIIAGVIGCGSIARFHFSGLEKAGVTIKWVCDISETAAKLWSEKFKARYTANYLDIINDREVNLVSVTSFSSTHKDICLNAIKARKAVICEKTLAENADDSLEIVKAAEKAKTIFYTSYMKRFIPAVEKGVKEALENGVLAGYPIVDLEVALYDGTFHDVDSSELAFKIAGSMALQSAVKKADLVLLEPIMKLEVSTPEEFMGDVIGNLSSKRAQILGTSQRTNIRVITALVPLAEMSSYATILRSMTQGRASFVLLPSHYEEVPKNITEQIIAARGEPVITAE